MVIRGHRGGRKLAENVEIKEGEQVEELKQNFFESRGTNSTKGKFGEDVLSI